MNTLEMELQHLKNQKIAAKEHQIHALNDAQNLYNRAQASVTRSYMYKMQNINRQYEYTYEINYIFVYLQTYICITNLYIG